MIIKTLIFLLFQSYAIGLRQIYGSPQKYRYFQHNRHRYSTITESIETNSIGDYLFLPQTRYESSYVINNNTPEEQFMNSSPNFDYSAKLNVSKLNTTILRYQLESLMPSNCPSKCKSLLIEDMLQFVNMMRRFKTENSIKNILPNTNNQETREKLDQSLVCRLQLLDTVRCPKWHMDYVNLRLVKTYYGTGTQFINPSDIKIRFLNFIYHNFPFLLLLLNSKDTSIPSSTTSMSSNLITSAATTNNNSNNNQNILNAEDLGFQIPKEDSHKIQTCSCGDILIMSGRARKGYLPVLHRSPPQMTTMKTKRLLFSVTIP